MEVIQICNYNQNTMFNTTIHVVVTPHVQRKWGKVISVGVHIQARTQTI